MDDTQIPRAPTTVHAVILPILALVGIIILIVPFVFHWRARNTSACALIFHLSILNFFVVINVLIWPDENFQDWWDGTGLCDIEAKLLWPAATGVAASAMAITRSLAIVLDVDRADLNPNRKQRRRKVIVDLAICFGIPIMISALHYIVQVNRYYILAIGGCLDSYDNSWPTIVIIYIWPLIFVLINVYYAVLVIHRLHHHRTNISSVLQPHSMNTTRFLRLFILSLLLLLTYLPIQIYLFYINVNIAWVPFRWSRVHNPATWNTVIYLPAQGPYTFDRYIRGAMALFVFAFFGMGSEATNLYRATAAKLGFARCFPGLLRERRPSADSAADEEVGWLGKLSLVRLGKRYFERWSRSAGTETTTTTTSSSSRKPSYAIVEHAVARPSSACSPTTPTFPPSAHLTPHPSPTTTPPASARATFLTRYLPFLPTAPAAPADRRRSSTHPLAHPEFDVERGPHDLGGASAAAHAWSPNAAAGPEGRFERLASVATQGSGVQVREGEVREGEVRIKTAVGVRVEQVV